MKTIPEIIEELGGSAHIARLVSPPLPPSTVSAWKQRLSIPVDRWPDLIRISGRNLTAHMLMVAHLQTPVLSASANGHCVPADLPPGSAALARRHHTQ